MILRFVISEKSLPIARRHSQFDYVYGLNDLAQVYLAQHQTERVIANANLAVGIAGKINLMSQVVRGFKYLSIAYKEFGPSDSAYKYFELAVNTRDSMYGVDKTKQLQLVDAREQNRQREVEQQKLDLRNKMKIYTLLGGLLLFSFVGFILYRNSRKEKEAKTFVAKKK